MPLDLLVNTLLAAAAHTRDPAIDPAIQRAASTLTSQLAERYPTVDLSRIITNPASARGRDYLAEDLAATAAPTDPALLTAAATLLAALAQNPTATQAAAKIGVDLAHVRAAALTLTDIIGEDIAILLRQVTIQQAITIRHAQAGTQPTATTNVLIGNQAAKIILGPEPPDFAALEQHYLLGLYTTCNEVALAHDGPIDATHQRQPRLQHIYVDLATTAKPTIPLVQNRLQMADVNLTKLQQQVITLMRTQYRQSMEEESSHLTQQVRQDINKRAINMAQSQRDNWMLFLIEQAEHSTTETAKQFDLDPDQLAAALAPFSILDAIQHTPQLVLLGDPGGGKSTLTRRLAGVLASQALPTRDPAEQAWLAELTACFGRWLLPLPIILSRWATHLPTTASGVADDLIAEALRLLAHSGHPTGLHDHLLARFTATPPTVLLLLDGLDEVADPDKRALLLKAVQHFTQHYPQVPLIITCRSRPWQAWQAAAAALPLPPFTLARLHPAAITTFVQRWHTELEQAGRYVAAASIQAQQRLLTAIVDPQRKDLADMAGTPLLLTMMARVNYTRGLPGSRAELYEAYLRQLLWEWERSKLDDRGQSTSLQRLLNQPSPPVPANNLELALSGLAFDVHTSRGDRDTVDIPESALRSALEAIHPSPQRAARAAWAVDVLDLIHERTGLLKSLDAQTLQFSHRTFQEYLAARHLATGDTATVLEKFRAKLDLEPWREAIILALGYQIAVQSQYDAALSILDELLPDAPQDATTWRRLLLLGEAYVHLLGPERARLAQQRKRAERLMQQIPHQLTAALQEPTLPPQQRLTAGRLLADLAVDPPGLADFVSAPGWAFQIARYPVTNQQFQRFITAGGYATPQWWSDKGWKLKNEEPAWTQPRYWGNDRFNWPTQPVVGVSWYEACAYCAWLTTQLRASGQISPPAVVRLPTQGEWEQAARSQDGRAYPWGPTFDAAHANTQESGLGQTTPVHMYPAGATPAGVWDLSGNVWEWTNDVDKDGRPWLKGGGWAWDKDQATSSARVNDLPDYWYSYLGFRCVVVPISR